MISALIRTSGGPSAPQLGTDLEAVGIQVVATSDGPILLRDVIEAAPDLIVCFENSPDVALFDSIAAVAASAPRPVVVFTPDQDAEKIALATKAGAHAYVINGYGVHRLRSVIHVAQARFRHQQIVREELAEVTQRFAERKLVDRAKGILMGARQLREEEAYRALRTAAMHGKQRIGQVAQIVIDSARYGEAINRAGQLRMLSQRLVKLYAQACGKVQPAETPGLFSDSLDHTESNLAILTRSLSRATFGDLLDAVLEPWGKLRTALKSPATPARLPDIDRLAEEFLLRAEQLTTNLEIVGFAAALHVINVAGRQRMLSQRMAKEALMAGLLTGAEAASMRNAVATTRSEFVEALAYLSGIPLTTAEIRLELGHALQAWEAFQAALVRAETPAGQAEIARLSEVLLGHFDRLTDQYERGMQTLVQ